MKIARLLSKSGKRELLISDDHMQKRQWLITELSFVWHRVRKIGFHTWMRLITL